MKPGAHRLVPLPGSRLARQDQEGGLEHVLSIMRVVEDMVAHPEDEGAMTPHQSRESRFIAFLGETPQQFPIRKPVGLRPCQDLADVLKDNTRWFCGHDRPSPRTLFSIYLSRRGRKAAHFFENSEIRLGGALVGKWTWTQVTRPALYRF